MSSELNNLTTHELAVLESLHGAPEAVSQRELARRTGLSVGLINAVIKKLVQTGYVKTGHLNRRSLEYLLTPQGFAHTAMRSYHYISDTVQKYRVMQLRLRALLETLAGQGFTDFYLHGDGELAELVAVLYADEGRGEIKRGLPSVTGSKAVVLNALPVLLNTDAFQVVDLVKELGNGSANKAASGTADDKGSK